MDPGFRYATVTDYGVTIHTAAAEQAKQDVLVRLGFPAGTDYRTATARVYETNAGPDLSAMILIDSFGLDNHRGWETVIRLSGKEVRNLRYWVPNRHRSAVGPTPRGPIVIYASAPPGIRGAVGLTDQQIDTIQTAFHAN